VPVAAQGSLLDDLLAPLEGLDFGRAYVNHQPFWNFLIYLVIFTAIAQLTLGRHFDKTTSPGARKALVAVIGLTFAFALAGAEYQRGFSLIQLSRISEFIFLLGIATVTFMFVRMLGGRTTGATTASLIIAYVFIRAAAPGFFEWVVRNRAAAFLHALFVLSLLVAGGHLVYSIVGGLRRPFSPLHRAASNPVAFARSLLPEGRQERDELIGTLAITQKEVKDSEEILEGLGSVRAKVGELTSPQARTYLAEAIRAILPKEHGIARLNGTLQERIDSIKNRDLGFSSRLTKLHGSLSDEEKAAAEAAIRTQMQKVDIEKAVDGYAREIANHVGSIRNCLEQAIKAIAHEDDTHAKEWLDAAIAFERQNERLLGKIAKTENRLLKIVEQELRSAKV
jgi:hypothetical protein